jgi:hypothetical protein
MSKVYVMPAGRLDMETLRKAFKKAKADARGKKAASTVEGGQQDDSKPTA